MHDRFYKRYIYIYVVSETSQELVPTMISKEERPLDVVIVGAGLAGLLAARVLREQHNVRVYERSSTPVEVGAAINIGPNGVRILNTLNFDRLNAGSLPVRAAKVFNKNGELTLDEKHDYPAKYGADWLFQHRADLRGEFLRLATEEPSKSGVPGMPAQVFWDKKVVDISPEEGSVVLSPGEEIQADLIIGMITYLQMSRFSAKTDNGE